MKAWYFSENNCRLRYGDNRIIKAGITHTVDCAPVLCEQGLHGSVDILDALGYAPGNWIWRVELGGTVLKDNDKCVATEREYLWGYDADKVLRKFSRLCALDVVHLWDAPDIVIRYLKTGDESIRDAAGDAAGDAAWAAGDAEDAAWAAARAARDAAWDAAWAAGGAAWGARDPAWAARAAAWAARAAQSRWLYRMIMEGKAK